MATEVGEKTFNLSNNKPVNIKYGALENDEEEIVEHQEKKENKKEVAISTPVKRVIREKKIIQFSGFYTFDENIASLNALFPKEEDWKIISETRTTTDHFVTIEKEIE